MSWSFFPACTEDELPPGSKLKVLIEGMPICVYNVGGTIYASGDWCPHEKVSLGDGGLLEGEVITCGAHRWCFNVRTGECYEPTFQDLGVEYYDYVS